MALSHEDNFRESDEFVFSRRQLQSQMNSSSQLLTCPGLVDVGWLKKFSRPFLDFGARVAWVHLAKEFLRLDRYHTLAVREANRRNSAFETELRLTFSPIFRNDAMALVGRCRPSNAVGNPTANPRGGAPSPCHGRYRLGLLWSNSLD